MIEEKNGILGHVELGLVNGIVMGWQHAIQGVADD